MNDTSIMFTNSNPNKLTHVHQPLGWFVGGSSEIFIFILQNSLVQIKN